jgi:hypothetical protein
MENSFKQLCLVLVFQGFCASVYSSRPGYPYIESHSDSNNSYLSHLYDTLHINTYGLTRKILKSNLNNALGSRGVYLIERVGTRNRYGHGF